MIEYKSFEDGLKSKQTAFCYLAHGEKPQDYMMHAIDIANLSSSKDKGTEKFFGKDVPQPKIGAILVTNEKVFCACRSALKNGDHAEFTVMETLAEKEDLNEAILYTTLEPCTPESRNKSESCSEVVINRRIKKVYIGTLDGNPLVFGRGVKYLTNNKIQIEFFDTIFYDKLKEINKEFFDFCEKYPDHKVMKEIDSYFRPNLNLFAVNTYLQGNAKSKYRRATEYELIEFYRIMLKKNQIFRGSFPGQLLCTKDFALAFLNDPSLFVPGCSVSIIDKTKNNNKRTIIHAPYIELLNQKSKESIYNLIDKETEHRIRLIESGEFRLIREILVNALVHSDYSENKGPTIIVDNDNLVIVNKSRIHIGKDNLNSFQFSDPVNPILMEFLLEARLVESTRLGFDEIQKRINNNMKIDIDTTDNHETTFTVSLSSLFVPKLI